MSDRPTAPALARRRRGARVARVLVGAVLALLLVVLLALAARNRIAMAVLPSLIGSELGIDVSIEAIDLGLRGDVRVTGLVGTSPRPWTPVRRLRVREVEGRVDLFRLLFRATGKFPDAIVSATVRVAEAEVDLDREGKRSPGEGEPSPFPWPAKVPRLDVEAERVEIVSGDASLVLDGLSLRSDGGRALEGSALAAFRAGERAGRAPAALEAAYAGAGRFEGVRLDWDGEPLVRDGALDALALAARARVLVAGGEVDARATGLGLDVASFSVSARGLALDEALKIALLRAPDATGRLDLEASGSAPLDDLARAAFDFRAAIRGGEVAGRDVDSVEVEGRVEPTRAEAARLVVQGLGTTIEGTSLSAPLDADDLESFLARAEGDLTVLAEDAGRLVVALAPDLGFPAEGLLAGASLGARLRVENGVATVGALDVAAPLFGLFLDGATIRPSPGDPLRSIVFASGRLAVGDVGGLARALGSLAPPVEFAGALDVSFLAAGPAAAPLGRAVVRGSGVAVEGFGPFDVDGIAEAGPGHVRTQGLFVVGADRSAVVSGAVDLGDLVITDGLVTGEARGLAAAHGLFFDSARIRARVSGPADWPDVEASVEADGFLDATIEKRGDVFEILASDLTAPGAEGSGAFRGTIDRGLRRGTLAIDDLVVAAERDVWRQEGPSRLEFDLDARAVRVDPPIVLRSGSRRVDVGIASAGNGGAQCLSIEAALPGRAPFLDLLRRALPRLDADARDLALSVEAELAGGAFALDELPRRVRARFRAGHLRAGEGEAAAAIAFDFESGPGGGRATLDAALSDVLVSRFERGQNGGRLLPGSAVVNVSWEGETARVEGLSADLAGVELEGGGTVRLSHGELLALARGEPLDSSDRFDLKLLGTLKDPSALRRFVPDVRRLSGSAELKASLSGGVPKPDLRGSVSFEGNDVRIGDGPPLVGLKGRARLEGEDAVIESLSGEVGGSKFFVGGGATGLFSSPSLHVEITGQDLLLVRTDDARIRGTPRLLASGPPGELSISGSLVLTDARIRRDVALLDLGGLVRRSVRQARAIASGPSAPTADGLRLFSFNDPPLSRLSLDVQVSTEKPVVLLGNVFSGKLRPEVRLKGTGQVPFIVGEVYLDDFVLNLPATKIRVESGLVRFEERNPFRPLLEMTGSTRMRGYDIDVAISGPFDDPVFVLSSNPPLPADQLMVLVATGRTPADESSRTDAAVLVGVVSYIGGDLLKKLFGNGGVGDDDSESLLDRFELDVGRNVSRSGEETIEARFRLKRGMIAPSDILFLTGERDEFEHYNVGLRIVFRGR